MSLDETRDLFNELQRIDALISKIEGSSVALEKRLPEITAVVMTTQQALRLTWRLTSLYRRMGLPEDVGEAMQKLTRLARIATYTYYAFNLLQMGTPYGVIAGTIGMINIALSPLDSFAGY